MIKTKYKKGVVINGDCVEGLNKIKDESIDLIFADPPFNIGYNYDQYKDKVPPGKYLSWTRTWMFLCREVLKPHGSIFVAIGDEYAAEMKKIIDETGLHFRNWIIWYYKFGTYCTKKFGRYHTHILYYTKDKSKFTFNTNKIRVPSARQSDYNDKRADPKGKVPGDVWEFSRVCGTFKERTKHPCQMPLTILDRIIKVASNKNDIVLDPFGGSGTTIVSAARLKRRFITFETSKEYVKIINQRLL